jgi:hypothetical protein
MKFIERILNTGLGAERTIGDDVYDYWLEGRNIDHGPVDIKSLQNFEKKKFSMFDELVKAAEKIPAVDKKLLGYIKHTKIFNFTQTVCYSINRLHELAEEQAEAMLTEFYNIPLEKDMLGLPFHNTCIVTPDAAVMFNAIESQEHAYMYTIFVNMHGNIDMQWFCCGIVLRPEIVTKCSDLKLANAMFYVKKANGKFVPFIKHDAPKFDASMIAPIIGKAMSLIMQLNTPDRFIMEITPTVTGVKSDKYIPKSHQRSEYIMLLPHVIRHYMKTELDVEGHKRRGHERRAHLRRYPDDPIRFPKAHGKTIQIPPLWIGRTESVVGDRQYKVIL